MKRIPSLVVYGIVIALLVWKLVTDFEASLFAISAIVTWLFIVYPLLQRRKTHGKSKK